MGYQRQTLQDLLDALKQSWESTPFWSDAEGIRYINHALRFWNLLTGYWRRPVLVNTTGLAYHTLPASLTFSMNVVWGDTGKPLVCSSLADLDYGRPRWEEEMVDAGGDVPTTPTLWAPVGMRTIAVWPIPYAGSTLPIDGVAATPVLSDVADYVDADDYVLDKIVGFALNVGCFKRGVGAVQATSRYYQEFVRAALEQNARLRRSAVFRRAAGYDLDRAHRPKVGVIPGQERGQQQGGGG